MTGGMMYNKLKEINTRPKVFQYYTAEELWTNDHTARQMLEYHLNEEVDAASRSKAFIEKSVRWIVDHFKIGNQTRIADFGCGPGLYTSRLAEKGAVVTGIDFSENSLDYARKAAEKNGLDIDYIKSNYLDFETDKRFDLIILVMCDFCALSPDQRKILLSKFRSLLKPNGSVLLDVYSMGSYDAREEAATYEFNQLNGFWSPDDYYCFVNTFKYDREKVILDKYTIIEAARTRIVYNWLQHYSRESLTAEFETNGFQIKEIFANVAGEPFHPDFTEMAAVAVPEE